MSSGRFLGYRYGQEGREGGSVATRFRSSLRIFRVAIDRVTVAGP